MKQAWTNKALFFLFPFLTVSGMYIANRNKDPLPGNNENASLISGTVIDAATNSPVTNTHVYIIHGEEEDITDEKGAFSIRATGAFPLTLSAEHSGYRAAKLKITAGGQKSLVKLSQK